MSDIKLLGDEELLKALRKTEYSVQQKLLKRVLRDAAKPMVKEMKRRVPKGSSVGGTAFSVLRTGNLERSIGIVNGKSKRSAIIFVGPRMGGSGKRSNRRQHSGWVANILEFAKGGRRTPKKGEFLSTPWGPRRSVAGIKRQEFVIPSIRSTMGAVGKNITKSIRTIITREWNKAKRAGIA